MMAPPSPDQRPAFPAITRQHSRSSSQLATFGSLALTSFSPSRRSGASTPPASGTRSPRYTAKSLTNSPDRTDGANGTPLVKSEDDSGVSSDSEDSDEQEELAEGLQIYKGKGVAAGTAGRRATSPSLARLDTREAGLLPATDPAAPANISFPDTSTGLAQLIQQKRRQASAPYFVSAREQSPFSPGSGFGFSGPSSATHSGEGRTGWVGGWGSSAPGEERRARSRIASRRGTVSGLHLGGSLAAPEMLDEPGMVMTPTTEVRQRGVPRAQKVDPRSFGRNGGNSAGSSQLWPTLELGMRLEGSHYSAAVFGHPRQDLPVASILYPPLLLLPRST